MPDLQKWKIAVARFNGYCAHLPSFPKQDDVNDYHELVTALEQASGYDFSSFRIPTEKLKPKLLRIRPASYGGAPGHSDYSREKYCDEEYFNAQIHALQHYLPTVDTTQTNDPKTHYDQLADWQLEELMVQRGIKPKSVIKDGKHVREADRGYIIAALIRQDHGGPAVTHNTTINISGSNVNYGSPGARITGNIGAFSKEEFANIVYGLRTLIAEGKLDDAAQNEVNVSIGTIELQLNSTRPNTSILKESLNSVRVILENAAGSLIASGVLATINHILRGL